jgi:hypothetical protein
MSGKPTRRTRYGLICESGYTVAETTDWSAAAVAGRGASPAAAAATNANRRPGTIPERRWYDLVC